MRVSVIKALMLVSILGIFSACQTPVSRSVEYDAWGPVGTLANVSYMANGKTVTLPNAVSLPWSITIAALDGDQLMVSANDSASSAELRAVIYVNGWYYGEGDSASPGGVATEQGTLEGNPAH